MAQAVARQRTVILTMMASIKPQIRLLLFRNLWRVERAIAPRLIRFSYFVRSSRWFSEHPVPFIRGPRENFYDFIIETERLDRAGFCYLEFGVSRGSSFTYWVSRCKGERATFVGFDTFHGLPDDWGSVKKGAYSAGGRPPVVQDRRASFEVGLFDATLPSFLAKDSLDKKLVVHLDADLYSSTLYVLLNLHHRLKQGDILIFDEFFSVSKADHEFRAFEDYVSVYKPSFQAIAKTPNQLAIKLA